MDSMESPTHEDATARIAEALFEQAAVGIAKVSLDGRWLRVNQKFCDIVGYSREEMKSFTFQDITYPADLEADLAQVRALLDGAIDTYSMEKRYIRKDGTLLWVNLTASLVRHPSGEPDYFISVVEDIGLRKKAEADREQLLSDIQQQAMELETVISSIADGIVIYGCDGEILRMNSTAQRMLGYSESEVAMPIEDRVRMLRVETVEGQPFDTNELPFVKALRGETESGTLVRLIHAGSDERPRWVSVSSAPFHDSTGEISGAVATFTDITELHDLTAWQQDLVRTVSHDLRTPLTAIMGNAQLLLRMLQKTGAEERYISNVGSIVRGAGRMDRMITDLVESARLESGQLPVEKQPIDLSEFVQELLLNNRKSLNVERVRVETGTNGNRACADPYHLDRILTNLISNALKYSDPDTEVLIATERRNGDLVITVADQGQGIPAQDIPHLFDRFYRVKGARKTEGLGLGLYITRMLVEAQGGRISVQSEQGNGSTFFVALPTVEDSSCS